MKKPHELRKELSGKVTRFEELAAKDQRTETEVSELSTLRNDIRSLTSDLDDAELLEAGNKRVASQNLSNKEKRDIQDRYSFVRAIRMSKDGKLDGIEKEMHDEALREAKSNGVTLEGVGVPMMVLELSGTRAATGQNVSTAADGGNLVGTEPLMYVDALKNALVLRQLGARYVGGLVGDLPIVRGGAFTSSWHGETDEVTTSKATSTKLTMTPKRLSVSGANSIQLINQASIDVEMWLRSELLSAHAQGLENAAINGTGADNQPTGLLNISGIGSVVGGIDGAAPDWKDIVDLETAIAILNANIGSLGYLTNAKVRGKLKQTLKAAGVAGYIWPEGGEMNGYKTAVTNLVPSTLVKGGSGAACSAIIFGNFNDMIIGQWGGLDMVVDPFSLKKAAEIEVTVHAFHDIAVRNLASFAAMKDALTV